MSDSTQDPRPRLIWKGDVKEPQWKDGKPASIRASLCRIVENAFGLFVCEAAFPNELGDTPNWINCADMGESDIATIYRTALRWLFEEMESWHQLADDAESERDAALEKAKSAIEFESRVKELDHKLTLALNRSAELEAECIELKGCLKQFNARADDLKWGDGRIFLRGAKWWCEFSDNGRQWRGSCYTKDRDVALAFLKKKLAARDDGAGEFKGNIIPNVPSAIPNGAPPVAIDQFDVRSIWRAKIDPAEEIENQTARGKVLEHIHDLGPATRARLQKMLDIPRSTIDKVCEELTWAGYIEQHVNGSVVTFPEPLECLGPPKWWPQPNPLLR